MHSAGRKNTLVGVNIVFPGEASVAHSNVISLSFNFPWHPSIKSSTDRANDSVWANDSTFAFSLCIWSIGRRTLDLQRHVSASLFISEVGLALHLAFVFRGLDGVIILRRHDTAGCGQKMGTFLHLLSSMAHVLQQKGYLPLHSRC